MINVRSLLPFSFLFFLGLVIFVEADEFDLPQHTPKQLEGAGLDKTKIGSPVELNTEFTDENGELIPLSSALLSDKPNLISVVYYGCPGLCNLHMNGAAKVFKDLDLKPGADFNWVLLSMDHTEGAKLAKDKKLNYLEQFPTEGAQNGWRFLTGSEENVKKTTSDLGFGFKWDEASKQYAHAAAFYVLSPGGKISQIIPGIEFDPKTVRLSLVEASQGKIGNFLDQFILFCFQFDPTKKRFTLYAYNLMRVAALFTLIIMGVLLVPIWIKEKGVAS